MRSPIGELKKYGELQDDWDGYGGIIPSPDILSSCTRFLQLLKQYDVPDPQTMVTGSGEVGLYWKGKSFYFEIGFDEPTGASYYYENGSHYSHNKVVCGEDDINFESMLEIARRITSEHI